ncbi:DegT/DnrJ/EryC1/StrS family aminotransferase [Candidatus Saccharibacteria bacterium]|nr:DegT/DnrJ/EryC1/StrS family aminotransferase [Candidatus Saccharibacteria bacterium]
MIFLGEASNLKGKTLHHFFTHGRKNDSLALKDYLLKSFGAKKAILTANGRSALCLALKTLIPKGSEVVLNGFTCQAVVIAIKKAGCIPIYADIEKETLNYSPETLENLLKTHKDIKAFIIQNSLGNPVDIEKFEKIAKKYDLKLIEDLAHCAGRKYKDGRLVGSVGDASAFSFGKGKSIDTTTGGALIFRETPENLPKTPEKKPKFSQNFRARFYPVFGSFIRASFRLHLNKIITGGLLKLHFIERSADAPLDLTRCPAHWQSKLALEQLKNSQKGPIRNFLFVENRQELLKKLRKKGYIFDEIWYDVPVSPVRYYKKSGFDENACPIATEVSKKIINLPTWIEKTKLKTAENIIKEYKI